MSEKVFLVCRKTFSTAKFDTPFFNFSQNRISQALHYFLRSTAVQAALTYLAPAKVHFIRTKVSVSDKPCSVNFHLSLGK
ncbi:MAG: hypothetical protein DKT66_26980 [Candidatus Melainabacteria bacterium]|nr:MAG: hypothetical protein DKT66_26980 [Candidatus Melainabacteria bacterium]